MTPRLTPAQNALLRQLRDAGGTGVPVDHIRGVAADKTLQGLVRRGVASISFGRAFAIRPPIGEMPDGDAA